MLLKPQALYWDLTSFGRMHPTGISRFTLALAQAAYPLPSVYLLAPYLADSAFAEALQAAPGALEIAAAHPRRRHWPWGYRWDQVLPQPGLILAPGNFHRPTRWPSILIVHDCIPYQDPAYRYERQCSWRHYRRLLSQSAQLCAVSRHTADVVRSLFGIEKDIAVIGQGLHERPRPQRPAWAPGVPFYLFVGSAEPRKRVADAVAFAAAADDAAIVIVGGDWNEHRMRDVARRWPRRHPLIHAEGCSDAELAWCYASCRALLHPSVNEGFGLPPLECLRSGRPIVARRVASLPEVCDGHAIWHDFGDGDLTEVLRKIESWKPTPELARHLSTFDWNRTQSALADAIGRILEGGG